MIFKMLKARKEKNLTQKDMAKLLGITQTYYSLIENGKRNPHIKIVAKLQEILGKEAIDLEDFK